MNKSESLKSLSGAESNYLPESSNINGLVWSVRMVPECHGMIRFPYFRSCGTLIQIEIEVMIRSARFYGWIHGMCLTADGCRAMSN